MDEKEVLRRLEEMGFELDRYTLDPFDLLVEWGPDGAFDAVKCYRLIDSAHTRKLDEVSRNWRPLLVFGDEVMVDPSPAMFGRLLAAASYFDRAEEFEDEFVFQLHRFALDFYGGYRVREQNLERDENEVIIRGVATAGGGRVPQSAPFSTSAVRGTGVEFNPGGFLDENRLPF